MNTTPKPICKVAQVTGEVPLECLFECKLNCQVDHLFDEEDTVKPDPHEGAIEWFFDDRKKD